MNKIIQEVTNNIIERSKTNRKIYLDMIEQSKFEGMNRNKMGCSNLAHTIAPMSDGEKELLMERSHGHIIISGEEDTIDNPVMASTLYMNGLFNSQIVLGNTTVNKFISNSR